MAVEITPLGFKKPDGNELVRGGDNVIADNAQKAQDLISGQSSLIAAHASSLASQGAQLSSQASTISDHTTKITGQEIRIKSVESAAFVGGGLLIEDPADPGFYIVGAP